MSGVHPSKGAYYVKKKITQREPEYDKNTDRRRRKSTQVKWGGRDGRREPGTRVRDIPRTGIRSSGQMIEVGIQKADKRVTGYLR